MICRKKISDDDEEERMEVDTDSELDEDTNIKEKRGKITDTSTDSAELKKQKLRKSDLIDLSKLSFTV